MRSYSKLHIHAIGFAVVAAIGLSGYLLSVQPLRTIFEQVNDARDESARLGQLLPQLESENKGLKREIALLPASEGASAKRDTQSILRTISTDLVAFELSLKNFAESGATAAKTDIDLEIAGDYTNLLRFVDQLVDPVSFAKLMRFELLPQGKNGSKCTAKIQARFTLDPASGLLSSK